MQKNPNEGNEIPRIFHANIELRYNEFPLRTKTLFHLKGKFTITLLGCKLKDVEIQSKLTRLVVVVRNYWPTQRSKPQILFCFEKQTVYQSNIDQAVINDITQRKK